MRKKLLELFGVGGSKVSQTIKSVKPTFPKNKIDKGFADLRKTIRETQGSSKKRFQDFEGAIRKVESKIGQTSQKIRNEPVTKSGFSKGKDKKIIEKKAKGGRVGLKAGNNPFKKKTNIDKIKETFGPKKRVNAKKGFPDLSGDGKTTFKDILIGRGVIKKGKKNKKTMMAKKSETPMDKAVKKDKKKKRII